MPAPGVDSEAKFVLSYSRQRPHLLYLSEVLALLVVTTVLIGKH